MVLPNNLICGSAEGGRNGQPDNDLCYLSHLRISATFIIIAGIDSVLHRHQSEVNRFPLSQANVSRESPLFSITPQMTLYVVLAAQCSVKKGACACA